MARDEIQKSFRSRVLREKVARAAKRALDLIGASLGLIILSPVMAFVGLLIKLDSPGPVIYRQLRIGRSGRLFQILKYRTMLDDARALGDLDWIDDSTIQPDWYQVQKIYNDPRVTWTGRLLRRLSLDELPQLWNVLMGEMSMVGPRPILPEQKDLYGDTYLQYIQARPGMTGLWQVSGRNKLSFTDRAEQDKVYLEGWSLSLDFQILLRTVGVVLRGDGAY